MDTEIYKINSFTQKCVQKLCKMPPKSVTREKTSNLHFLTFVMILCLRHMGDGDTSSFKHMIFHAS
jgi:hypothetical protein